MKFWSTSSCKQYLSLTLFKAAQFKKSNTDIHGLVSSLDPEDIPEGSMLLKGKLAAYDTDRLIADYLTRFGAHLMYLLRKRLGTLLQGSSLHFVLTVPAMWSDHAKQRTTQAFHRALSLPADSSVITTSEPEAAATYVLSRMKSKLEVGQCYMVLDAGGGTVDLISYKIRNIDPLEVSEAAAGSGGACGSAFLNDNFRKYLISKLNGHSGFDGRVLRAAMKKFDSVGQHNTFSTAFL